jgi:hypothetical protein
VVTSRKEVGTIDVKGRRQRKSRVMVERGTD